MAFGIPRCLRLQEINMKPKDCELKSLHIAVTYFLSELKN